MIMLAITHSNLILPDSVLTDATLLCEGERIAAFGRDLKVPAGAEVLDAHGLYVGPGFVDIHTHSDGVHWFHEEPEIASATLLRHGVTSVLPALYFNLDQKGYLDAIASDILISIVIRVGSRNAWSEILAPFCTG